MGWLSTGLGGWEQFGSTGMGCGGSRITPFLGAAPLRGTGCFLGPGGWQGASWPVGARAYSVWLSDALGLLPSSPCCLRWHCLYPPLPAGKQALLHWDLGMTWFLAFKSRVPINKTASRNQLNMFYPCCFCSTRRETSPALALGRTFSLGVWFMPQELKGAYLYKPLFRGCPAVKSHCSTAACLVARAGLPFSVLAEPHGGLGNIVNFSLSSSRHS